MTHGELAAALPLYSAGALERKERQTLEAHLLSGCIPCHVALKEYQSVAVMLPFGLDITPPPKILKDKIMSSRASSLSAGSETQRSKPSLAPGKWMNHLFPPSSPRTTSFGGALGMVIFAVLIILVLFGWNASTQMTEDLAQLQSQAEEMGSKLGTLQQQLGERAELLAQTREELQRRTAELAEIKDQLIRREAELEELRVQLAQGNGRSPRTP